MASLFDGEGMIFPKSNPLAGVTAEFAGPEIAAELGIPPAIDGWPEP